jgi:(hydroxyamino)benzene mutase
MQLWRLGTARDRIYRSSMRSVSHTLILAGFTLLLLSMLIGLLVSVFAVPARAVSAHVLGVAQGTLLAVVGVVWPRLALGKRASVAAAVALLYGCGAAWLANLGAAIWPAGGATFPLIETRGTPAQELVIAIVLRSSAIALIAAVVLLLVGLCRSSPAQ